MTITNPSQLVDEFKKAGEFDRLRRELLRQFQRGDGMSAFTARIEDIARQRLVSDQKLLLLPHDSLHRELMQEVDRYPIVERAVAEVRTLTDPSFATAIREAAQRILAEDRAKPPPPPPSIQPKSSHSADRNNELDKPSSIRNGNNPKSGLAPMGNPANARDNTTNTSTAAQQGLTSQLVSTTTLHPPHTETLVDTSALGLRPQSTTERFSGADSRPS